MSKYMATSGQSNFTTGRIAATHGRFSGIRQVAGSVHPLLIHGFLGPRKSTSQMESLLQIYTTTGPCKHGWTIKYFWGDVDSVGGPDAKYEGALLRMMTSGFSCMLPSTVPSGHEAGISPNVLIGRPQNKSHVAFNFPSEKWKTRMWANAQRDGRPAEHRWHPLFSATKFSWRPLLDAVQ